jgi:hypothetical protein
MNKFNYQTITHCRICGKKELSDILKLGNQPPANSLRDNFNDKLPLIPLSIVHCGFCKAVQLRETVNPEYLFREYLWVTGTSSMAKTYSFKFCAEVIKHLPKKQLFIVEVASNDGTFLKPFKEFGHKVLGVDPAENLAQVANEKGVPTLPQFFNTDVAKSISENYGKPDCIFARNVIPHVENIHDVVTGMANCIKDEGIVVVEVHYAKNIMEELQYDSIYHEHLIYFSIQSLCFLLEKHGLWAFDCLEGKMNGGSLALLCAKKKREQSSQLQAKIQHEEDSRLGSEIQWLTFAENCFKHRKKLKNLIENKIKNNTKIIGYGASARSSTLLNFCEINHNHLACIGDGNPLKQGKFTAGTDIPIVSPDISFAEKPDSVLLLSWNFKNEILSIMKDKFNFKGEVILPLPNEPQVIEI